MELRRVIQYSDLYPEDAYNLPDAKSFIKGLTRDDLCSITANMVQRISESPFYDSKLDPKNNEYDFVSFFLSRNSSNYRKELIDRYNKACKSLPSSYNNTFYATSKVAIMSFQRLFFSVKPQSQRVYSNKTEECFSKALLLSNEAVYGIVYNKEEFPKEPDDVQLARLYLAYNYANEDVQASNIHDLFRCQLVKSISLFSFLFRSKDKRIKILRRKFLEHFHIGRWVEYIIIHVISIHSLNQNSGILILQSSDRYGKKARRVVEKSCIEKDLLIPERDNPDFVVFRSKPFIRLKKHHYAITNPSFVIEHIFNSVYFELKQYRKDAGFVSDNEFRQYYTTEFSQINMFERYVKSILPSNTLFSISGSQCDKIIEKARNNGTNTKGIVPPDYFIRAPEGCIVFEYKDALTNAKVKESRDVDMLFAEIRKKFFENESGSHKGVTQLLDSAKSIQDGTFFFDKPLHNSAVYPVLVVDNPVYTMRGMRNVLEYMMREECLKRGMCSKTIKPLVIVEVAALKLYADYLNTNGLIAVFENYYKHIDPQGKKVKEDIFETLLSFNEYIKSKPIQNMGLVFDRIMREAKRVLLH